MKIEKNNFLLNNLPKIIFGSAFFIVFISWLAFYLVDLRNIFGFRDILFNLDHSYFFFTYRPFLFHHLGRNSGFLELWQWFFLGGSIVISAFLSGNLYRKNNKLSAFWALMSIAFIFMVFEDAGDTRHTLMSYVQAFFDEPDQGIMGTLAEFIYFSALASLPLLALIFYFRELKNFLKVKILLLIGFISYAAAASLSFVGSAFEGLLEKNFYDLAGESFYQLAVRIGDFGLAEKWGAWNDELFSIEFFLMDSLIEESIELIGAGAFLAAVVLFLISMSRSLDSDEKPKENQTPNN